MVSRRRILLGLLVSAVLFSVLLGNSNRAVAQSPQSTKLCDNRIDELNGASGWTLLGPSDGRVNTFEISPDKKIYYIGTNSAGVFRSLDYGQTWEHYSSGLDTEGGLSVSYLKFVNGILHAVVAKLGGDVFETRIGVYALKNDVWTYSLMDPTQLEKPGLPIIDKLGYMYYGPYGSALLLGSAVNFIEYSLDGGKTRDRIVAEGIPGLNSPFWDIRQIYPLDDGRVVVLNDNGVTEVNVLTRVIKRFSPVPNSSEITSISVSLKSGAITSSYWDHQGVVTHSCGKEWESYIGSEFSYFYAHPYADNIQIEKSIVQFIPGKNYDDFNKQVRLIGLDKSNGNYQNAFLSLPAVPNEVSSLTYNVAFDASKSPTRAYLIFEDGVGKSWLESFNMVLDESLLDVKYKQLPFDFADIIMIDPSNPNRLVVVSNFAIFESTDKGEQWTKTFDFTDQTFYISAAINPFDSSEMVLGGTSGNLLKLKNWSKTDLFLPYSDLSKKLNPDFGSRVVSLAYDDKLPQVIYSGSVRGFFYSKNGGNTWKEFDGGLYSKDIRKIVPAQDKVFIGTWGSGNAVILKEKLLSLVSEVKPLVFAYLKNYFADEATGEPAIYNFSRSGTTVQPLTINFVISGTAINGTDYELINNSITIPSGYSEAEVKIKPLKDSIDEDDETVEIAIIPSASYTAFNFTRVGGLVFNGPSVPGPLLSTSVKIYEPNQHRTVFVQASHNIFSWRGGAGTVKVALVKADFNPSSDSIIGWITQNSRPDDTILWDGLQVTSPTGTSVPVQIGSYKLLLISQNALGSYCFSSFICNYDLSFAPFQLYKW